MKWVPKKSIGSLVFDQIIDLNKLPFECELIENEEWLTYRVTGKSSQFYLIGDRLDSVECSDSCVYEGTELIGLKLSDLVYLLQRDYIVEYSWANGIELNFPDLGALVWVENGIVDSIGVSS